jgi:hypothetical protein
MKNKRKDQRKVQKQAACKNQQRERASPPGEGLAISLLKYLKTQIGCLLTKSNTHLTLAFYF